MNYDLLQNLQRNPFFTVGDLSELLKIKQVSARVLCNRYVKKNIFVRLKRNMYILDQSWQNFSREDFLQAANILQVPSYISFMTALSFYDVTTQIQRNFFESASLKRSVKFDIKETVFNYYKLKKLYYFNFVKKDNIFIATKEKAFVDSIYLYSFGKYKLDISSLDISKLDKNRLRKIVRIFPSKTRRVVNKICRI